MPNASAPPAQPRKASDDLPEGHPAGSPDPRRANVRRGGTCAALVLVACIGQGIQAMPSESDVMVHATPEGMVHLL